MDTLIDRLWDLQEEGRGNLVWMVAPNGKAARTKEGQGIYKFTTSGKNGGKKGIRAYFARLGYVEKVPVYKPLKGGYRGHVSYENGPLG